MNILDHPDIKNILPKYYVEIRHELSEVFSKEIRHYSRPQPVPYCKGKQYFEYPEDSYERLNWGQNSYISSSFNNVMRICRVNDSIWSDFVILVKTFLEIYHWYNTYKEKQIGDIHPLFNFEIDLLLNGYNIASFDELNAYKPGYNLYPNIKKSGCSRYYINENDKKIFYVTKDNIDFYYIPDDLKGMETAELIVPINIELLK